MTHSLTIHTHRPLIHNGRIVGFHVTTPQQQTRPMRLTAIADRLDAQLADIEYETTSLLAWHESPQTPQTTANADWYEQRIADLKAERAAATAAYSQIRPYLDHIATIQEEE